METRTIGIYNFTAIPDPEIIKDAFTNIFGEIQKMQETHKDIEIELDDLCDLVCDVRDEIVDYLQFHDIFPEKEDQD